MAAIRSAAIILSLKLASATVLNNMDDGSAFTQCISISDFQTMTMADDITLVDRDSTSGCCPSGSVPGAKAYSNYEGAQVTCGWQDDGSISLSTGTTCTYNHCFIQKQGLACSDGSTQRINGCCGDSGTQLFESTCSYYDYSFTNAASESVNYCLTYHQNYGTLGWGGTAAATDDVSGGALVVDNVYHYAACSGSGGSGGDSSSSSIRVVAGAFALVPSIVASLFM